MRFTVASPSAPHAAFDAVADFGHLAEWDPFVRSVEIEGEPMVVGAVYTLRAPGGFTLRYRLIEVDPGHRAVYGGGSKRGGSTDTITVVPRDDGCEVEIVSILHFAGWARFVGPIVSVLVWLGGRFVSLPSLRRRLAELG